MIRLELDERYRELRASGRITRVELPYGGRAWLATRYDHVRTVLSDPRFSRAAAAGADIPRVTPEIQTTLRDEPVLLDMDPPEHTRIRGLVAKVFTARRVERLRPRVQRIADELLDTMLAGSAPANLVNAFTMPLPLITICELLGVPPEDQVGFRAWVEADPAVTAFGPEEIERAREMVEGYLIGLIAARRAAPRDDLLSALVAAKDREQLLTERELEVLAMTLLVGGYETAADQIGNFCYTLLSRPERYAELVAEPELLPSAIEELLRFVPLGASAGFPRMATEDVWLGDTLVRAGEVVFAQADSANRDEDVFDRPDTVDFRRDPNPHLGFLHGPHHCLGAQLARVELRVALGTLLRRLPDLRLAVPAEEVPFRSGRLTRGVYALPVVW
ncbi:Cytochrome P450 [Amycolatopsis arida]|uniref:Cytochrome P450 n=1 Tax=Amycolatopsis arida TaxID=587909 RepID=A0A1I5LY42_9PSEU|nr:cytochrome P450 [Amycolatopsis arida]TDX93879.1 cytochrome P450 [Amycolatopsis arida]SFP01676.1 Cytochrome P450 [Amycolatopsis arida]